MVTKAQKELLSTEEVPEVHCLLEAEQELQKHIASNPDFYRKLSELATKRNGLAAIADAKVREMGVSCGPFVMLRSSKEINVEKLFEELGDDQFKTFGGYTETVVSYKIDRARFLSYADSEAIPKEILDTCVTDKHQYKKLPMYTLP